MCFFRNLSQAAPSYNPELPWPLGGMAYTIMFCCPLMCAPILGLLASGLTGLAIGTAIAVPIWLGNILCFDYFLDERLARLQQAATRAPVRAATNILGFAWALALSAIPVAVLLPVLKLLLIPSL